MVDDKYKALETTLQKIAKQRNKYKDYKLQITPIESGGANYSSLLYSGKISTHNEPDLHWFGKVALMNEKIREAMPMELYFQEQYAYSKLFSIFEEIENMYDVRPEYRLNKPKLYGYSVTAPHEVIVMQDLTAEGYAAHDRLQAFGWEYASAAMQQLAILHAHSVAVKQYYPKEFEKLREMNKMNMEDMKRTIEGPIKNTLVLIKEENRQRVEKCMENLDGIIAKLFTLGRRPIMTHGDYRMSNIMHKVDENGKISLFIVDYQTYTVGSVVSDLMYFIFTGSDAEFRRQHYHQLLEYYYEQLCAALNRLHLDPRKHFPREDFDEDLKEFTIYGLLIALLTLPVVTVDAEDAPTFAEDVDVENMMNIKHSPLCMERLNDVVTDFIEWGII